jgi:NAD(P)H-hydrate epimerase
MTRLTRAQVREIDRRASADYNIPGIVLMENASQAVAQVALEMIAEVRSPSVVIVCGPGNNGGDGLAAARHLHNLGIDDLQIVLSGDPDAYRGDAEINWKIVKAMKLPVMGELLQDTPTLYVDAIFGTGLTRPVDSTVARMIDVMNASSAHRLAVDIPSGLDCDSGEPTGPCVRAHRTITFVAEKIGFANPRSRKFTGKIAVGEIGCPNELIDAVADPD